MDTDAQLEWLRSELVKRDAEIVRLSAQVAELTQLVEKLQEQLGQNSRNSSKPPSSDGPSTKSKNKGKGKSKSKRKRGGQPKHKGHQRSLLPASEVDEFVDLFPQECANCFRPLDQTPDANALRHQVTEVPPIRPHTTEFRRHSVGCSCGHHTRVAPDDPRIPQSAFGPRLCSIVALLTGVYHVSRRQAQQLVSDLLGVTISLGALSHVEARVAAAIKPGVEEAWEAVQNAEVKHTDGTGWLQCHRPLQLWTIACTMATVYKIVCNGSKATIGALFKELRGILVSDRAAALNFWAMENRQICWSHLIRRFVAFSERDGPAGAIGQHLLEYSGILFAYWHAYKDGQLSRQELIRLTTPLRAQFEVLLASAAAANIERLSGSCDNILKHRAALWTFIDNEGVEPTNNHAEQELRKFVLWRKRCFGSQSERGSEFAESMMTIAHTARKQDVDLLGWISQCCRAAENQTPAPALIVAA